MVKARRKRINSTPNKELYDKIKFWSSFYFMEVFVYNFSAVLISWFLEFTPKMWIISLCTSVIIYWCVTGKKDITEYISSKLESKYAKEHNLEDR